MSSSGIAWRRADHKTSTAKNRTTEPSVARCCPSRKKCSHWLHKSAGRITAAARPLQRSTESQHAKYCNVTLPDCDARRQAPTVLDFAGAVIHENGQIQITWPDGERARKANGRRESTVRHMRDGLRPFIREFHDRPLDSFLRDEAVTRIRPKNTNVQSAVRQFFNHAVDRDLIPRNQFTRLGASKRKRRVDRPDFQIINDEQYERLRRCACESRADDYGLILEGAILAIGEAAMRPGEIFALQHSDIDFAAGLVHVRRQLDLASGVIDWPKDDEPRAIAISPALHTHLGAGAHRVSVRGPAAIELQYKITSEAHQQHSQVPRKPAKCGLFKLNRQIYTGTLPGPIRYKKNPRKSGGFFRTGATEL
jgi:hypothetical protein